MKNFKCPKCGGSTEKVWENETKTRFGMRCIKGHVATSNKSAAGSQEHPVFLVSREDLE